MKRDDSPVSLVQEVHAFLAGEPRLPSFSSLDERFAYLRGYQSRLNAVGLAVPAWPNRYGGRDLTPKAAAVVARALGEGGAPELINFVGTDVVGPALLQFADGSKLERWLPPMASADEIWCQLFSEPDAGSELTNLRTRAEDLGTDGWRITGQKIWSTWAQYAHWGVLLARTGAPDSRHRGISAFVLPMDLPGIDIRPLVTMTGSAEFAEVFFEDVVLPRDALVGEVNQGWSVAQVVLNAERGPYAVRRGAVIAAELNRVLAAARALTLNAPTRELAARAYTALRLLELNIDANVERLAAGQTVGREAAVTKQLMTTAEQLTFDLAVAVEPDAALAMHSASDVDLIDGFLYSRAASIYGGSSQIQRNIIGEGLLGLPRDA